jgi:hypothetical protein
MHPLAREVLERLWRVGDGADLRASSRTPSVALTPKQFPGYAALPSHADKERFHAELMQAQRIGAIAIVWDRRAGPGGQIQRVTLVSLPALASLLELEPTTRKLAQAKAALSPWRTTWPAVQALLDAWHAGRSPRGVSVDALPKIVDAARLLDHCREQQYRDVSERRVSAQLFHDSKRIEALTVVLDLLTAPGDADGDVRHAEVVLAGLGLLKHPSPLLVAGPVQIQTSSPDGGVDTSPVLSPYSGYSPRQVVGAVGTPVYLLSVENLTVFHELANGLAGPPQGVVLYTGGYPSPSQLRAYVAIVRSLPPEMPLWHWGDTDLGGFRIAGLLAGAIDGQRLRLWNMATYGNDTAGVALSTYDLARIDALCARWGWHHAQASVAHHGWRIEQELQSLCLP